MKFTTNPAAFAAAFGPIARIAGPKSPMPILQSVLVEARDGTVTLRAQGSEVSASRSVGAVHGVEDGLALLPRAKVDAILKLSDDETMAFSVEGTSLVIAAGDAEWTIPQDDPALFPTQGWDFPGEAPTLTLKGSDLKLIARRTLFATNPLVTQFALRGVCFRWAGGGLEASATDTYVIASQRVEATLSGEFPEEGRLVPKAAMEVAVGLFGESDEMVEVAFPTDRVGHFRSGGTHLRAILVEGRFPRWQELVKDPQEFRLDFPTAEFARAIDKAGLMTDADSNALRFAFDAGTLTLSGAAPSKGGSRVRLAVAPDQAPAKFAPGVERLKGTLAAISDCETFTLEYPRGFDTLNVKVPGFLCVINPLDPDIIGGF